MVIFVLATVLAISRWNNHFFAEREMNVFFPLLMKAIISFNFKSSLEILIFFHLLTAVFCTRKLLLYKHILGIFRTAGHPEQAIDLSQHLICVKDCSKHIHYTVCSSKQIYFEIYPSRYSLVFI